MADRSSQDEVTRDRSLESRCGAAHPQRDLALARQ